MKNMGTADRIIRLLAALVFVYLFATGAVSGWLGYLLMAFAGIFTVTSLVRTCPIYSILGIRTCPMPDKK
jgi:hypothetical protein